MIDDNDKKNNHHGDSKRPIDDVSSETYSWWKKNYVLIKKTKIRTWKGVFLLAFIVGAAVALIWTVSINIHQFLKAEGETASMKLDPASIPVQKDAEFDVDVVLDTKNNNVVVARAIINYDKDVLQLVRYNTNESAFASGNSCMTTAPNESCRIVKDSVPGTFEITLAKPSPGVKDSSVVVATLTFKALKETVANSSSAISLNFNTAAAVGTEYADSDAILDNSKGTDILTTVSGALVAVSITPPPPPEPPIPIAGEDVESPKIKIGDKKSVKIKASKKFYSKDARFAFKGKISGLAGGKVKAFVDGDLDKEIVIGSNGEWKFSKKGKNNKTYNVEFKYYNTAGQEVDDSSEYEIKIDTSDPEFTDLPLALNKIPGTKVWWKAEDNSKIDHFTYEFLGKKVKTEKDSFIIPAKTPRGMHWLVVNVFDKAGNKETRRVLIRVR